MRMMLLACALFLQGCTTGLAMMAMNGVKHCSPEMLQTVQHNVSRLPYVQRGQPQHEAIALLGYGEVQNAILTRQGVYDVQFYRTGQWGCRVGTAENTLVPVVFYQSYVIGVGEEAYAPLRAYQERRSVSRDGFTRF